MRSLLEHAFEDGKKYKHYLINVAGQVGCDAKVAMRPFILPLHGKGNMSHLRDVIKSANSSVEALQADLIEDASDEVYDAAA